jgi:hypothetical protein
MSPSLGYSPLSDFCVTAYLIPDGRLRISGAAIAGDASTPADVKIVADDATCCRKFRRLLSIVKK